MPDDVPQTTNLPCERTPYGFKWGVTTVSRACEHNGYIALMIETPRQRMTLRVTPTGLIRFDEPAPNDGEVLCVAI